MRLFRCTCRYRSTLKIDERIAKMLGWKAPVKAEVTVNEEASEAARRRRIPCSLLCRGQSLNQAQRIEGDIRAQVFGYAAKLFKAVQARAGEGGCFGGAAARISRPHLGSPGRRRRVIPPSAASWKAGTA
jgi:hypothetical protein